MSAPAITIPAGAKSIDQILSEARSYLQRLTPALLHHELQSSDAAQGPTHLIDIRPAAQRSEEGPLTLNRTSNTYSSLSDPAHKVHIIERNVLEWRLDPQSHSRLDEIVDEFGYQTRVVVVCSEGYTSSLAARELQRLGLRSATDLEGGYWAWMRFLEGKDNGDNCTGDST
jgi:rhodanese-related sulfurtransferase